MQTYDTYLLTDMKQATAIARLYFSLYFIIVKKHFNYFIPSHLCFVTIYDRLWITDYGRKIPTSVGFD